jgi:hypothetical protein
MTQKIILTLVILLIFLVAADLLGVGVCLVGACGFLPGWSKGAAYTLWFVFGVFIGLIQYFTTAEDKPATETQAEPGPPTKWSFLLAFIVTVAALGALTWLFYQTGWRRGVDSEDMYVPDSMSATLTLFISILVMMLFSMWLGIPVESTIMMSKASAIAGRRRDRHAATRKGSPTHRRLP